MLSKNYRSPSPDSSVSSFEDDINYADIDELDRKSRRLTDILRKTVNRTASRRSVLDIVRDKAWLLEDQVKLLQNKTTKIKNSSNGRRLAIVGISIVGFILIINKFIHYHVEN